ncbi:MAG: histidine ammonia-lyase [Tissierellia bacterium]|nr:histidine ammonia-lyase [Tissierellia bacterium]
MDSVRIEIDGSNLTLEKFIKIARNGELVKIADPAVARINQARGFVDTAVEEERVIYGLTTGFGKFSDVSISKEDAKTLQRNLILSHACGVGKALSEEVSRGVMLLRANALAKGNSGIRLSTVSTLIDMLNKGVHPIIPEKGSLGSSGDLAPLSHMVLVMIGEGEAIYKGERMPGREAMERANIKIVELTSKEGLALINGTQVMTSIGAFVVYDAIKLSKYADLIASMTVEAMNGITDAYDPRVHEVRNQSGQMDAADNLLRILKDSNNTSCQGEIRVQDSYTLRCIPQVHGASKDAIEYVRDKVEKEMNAATDNPLIFPGDGDAISGGNFHGQPMALAFDFLGIALSEYANISERRLEKLVNPALSEGLPAFLAECGGLNSGFMIIQYSAASLVSENKVLAHPASVDSIPSSANQEDHVSMGTIAARKATEILFNARNVLGMELLTACQALDLRGNKGLGQGTKILYDNFRKKVEYRSNDKAFQADILESEKMLKNYDLLDEIEEKIGLLK